MELELGKSVESEESSSSNNEHLPSDNDVIDLVKFAFLFQQQQASDLCAMDLSRGPASLHSLSHDLRVTLEARLALEGCSFRAHGDVSSASDELVTEGRSGSDTCQTKANLRDLLAELVQENLLQSIVPNLALSGCGGGGSGRGILSNNSGRGVHSKGQGKRGGTNLASADLRMGQHDLQHSDTTDGADDLTPDEVKSREVTIHVCDDNRNARKDFQCPESLLLKHMGYFRDITSGQSLDDVDISVHCDIAVFEWLINWIRTKDHQGQLDHTTVEPKLDASNVMSVLVSASFLKMDFLVTEALAFAHQDMNKILAVTQNLNYLAEPLLTKLALFFKPSEVEDLLDRRDRIQSKLFIKLIQTLVDPVAHPEREIFFSAATLFQCSNCGLFLTQDMAKLCPCSLSHSVVCKRGEIVPKHNRDPNFQLNEFLKSLRTELKSWRRVFWRLWGMIHPLYCSLCCRYFPVYLLDFCSFHPQDPEFKTIQFKNSCEPFGEYPCCQGRVLRFQPTLQHAKNVVQGCQSRDHRVRLRSDVDKAIFHILMAHRETICLAPVRKTGIKLTTDANSITLPKPFSDSAKATCDQEESDVTEIPDLAIKAVDEPRTLLDHSSWKAVILESMPTQTATVRKNASFTNLASASGASTSSTPPVPSAVVKFAARRWKNIAYGRLKRTPKMPIKSPSTESSSASEDESEDSSSASEEDENVDQTHSDHPDGPAGEEETDSRKSKFKLTHGVAGDKLKLLSNPNSKPNQVSSGDQTLIKKPLIEVSSSCFNPWLFWDNERPTRSNQDSQRDMEATSARAMMKVLVGYQQQAKARHTLATSQANRSWNNLGQATGGAFLKLEQDWRETHMAYLQHRTSTNGGLTTSASSANIRAATPGNLMRAPAMHLRPNSATSLKSTRLMRVGK